jgi:hypothetical protein
VADRPGLADPAFSSSLPLNRQARPPAATV